MQGRRITFGVMMAFVLWAAFVATPRAFAQDPNKLSQLTISVWPEHDKPTVLVLLDGTLADSSNLPHPFSVLVPSSAQSLVASFVNADGSFAPEQPTTATNLGNGFTVITYTVATAKIHFEYYDDLLRGAPDKTMDFVYKAQSPADQATLEIQQPTKATNFSVDPSTQTTRDGTDGFKYFVRDLGAITAGQTITEQVKYTKTDPNPSVMPTVSSITPIPAPASATPAAPSPWSNIFILVAVVVVGIVAVIGFFLWQQRSREPALARAASRNRPRRNGERTAPSGEVAAYCTQCGHGLSADDLFCPRCGTKRRVV